jgi:Bacterial PH domain
MENTVLTYRRKMRWFLAALMVLPAFMVLGGIFAAPTVIGQIACGLASTLAVGLIVRILTLAVILRPAGMTVRNLFRNYTWRWDEIERVEDPPRYGTWLKGGIRIHLRSGQIVSATAYARGGIDSDSLGHEVVEAIRSRIHAAGADSQLAAT